MVPTVHSSDPGVSRAVGRRAPPRSPHRPGKALTWVLVILGGLAVIAAISSQATKAQKEALAEADALHKTNPAAAAAKYKEGYPAAGPRKAEVLQRIVDHEAASGDPAEARKWVDRGLDDGIAVEYTTPAAKDLFAKAQRERADRAAAKQAEKDAKAAQRNADQGARDGAKANRNLPREQLRALLAGKTQQQVRDALGKPDETQDVEGVGQMWYYHNIAPDPVTSKKTALVQIAFEGGTVQAVNFN